MSMEAPEQPASGNGYDPLFPPMDEPIRVIHGNSWSAWLDRLLAGVLLVVLAPLLLLIAAIIKLESPRSPILYLQERVGKNRRNRAGEVVRERRNREGEGRPFRIWKFRTMIPDAEAASGPVWASEDDPRITSVGRFMRKTRMDELPQLINVIRGEMRLVGPRPERPHFVGTLSAKVPGYKQRLKVDPGITGLAQVEREYDRDVEDVRTKLRYDLYYIENRRPTMDIKILLKTISVVLKRRGAK